jgi:alpha-ketoglutaric semialdehyde dehydrogenase
VQKMQDLTGETTSFPLLTRGICSSYDAAVSNRASNSKVTLLAEGTRSGKDASFAARCALFLTDAPTFLADHLGNEIFGPTTLLVRHSSREEVLSLARSMEGHLTATIHGTDEDLREFADLISILENKVGRIIFNGFPTGVEVTHAMVHAGPYPSSWDGRSTSVGSQAILRFARPVCYQGFPDSALPDELKNANPLGIWRMLDGEMTRRAA